MNDKYAKDIAKELKRIRVALEIQNKTNTLTKEQRDINKQRLYDFLEQDRK